MITFKQKGDFRNTESFFKKNVNRHDANIRILQKYGEIGVSALRNNTPVDTGKTANSWDYRIVQTKTGYKLEWTNSNVVDGVPIAIVIQYGHGTRNGGYVQGIDYITPALQPIFDKLSKELWREVRGN